MSPDAETRGALLFELNQIRKELSVLSRMLGKTRHLGRDEVQIRAAASSLQSVYNGIEKILETVLKNEGYSVKAGPSSHSDVINSAESMGIVSTALAASLRNLMAFRHFYRHSYGFMIDNELLNPLLQNVDDMVRSLAEELHLEQSGA